MTKTPLNNFISVKEFAQRAGVSTQSIYKQLDKRLATYSTKVGNRTMIDISALSELYGVEVVQPNSTELATVSTEESTYLQKYIQKLEEQLEKKDKQIEDLTQMLDQEQRLHAADKQELLKLQDKKRKWWPF